MSLRQLLVLVVWLLLSISWWFTVFEIMSLVASVLILVANAVKSIRTMRIIFLVADLMFVVYGIHLDSVSLVFLNSSSSFLMIYKLWIEEKFDIAKIIGGFYDRLRKC